MKLLELFKELSLHPKNAAELKALILQLAVQGKLTAKWREENPDVEPASELLKKIQVEKGRLVNEKKIKRDNTLLPTISDEMPFKLPKSWMWCKMIDICKLITDGTHHTPKYQNDGIPFLSVKDMSGGFLNFENTRFVSKETHKELMKRCHPEKNDILLTKVGTTGIAISIDTDREFSIFVSVALLKIFSNHLFSKFLEYCINSPFIKLQSEEGTEGVGNKNLVLRKIKAFDIPLPPLKEQHAIVTTVNQLFVEVEQLEQLTKERIQLKHNFAASALHRLVKAGNINGEWAAVQQHFHTFFNEKPNVKKLRETILQLAVQGKLTTHWRKENPGVEPATELLKRITAEKQELVNNGKIKKEKPLPPVKDDEIPFELPEGWVWCRLGEVIRFMAYGTSQKTNDDYKQVPVLRMGNISSDGKLNFNNLKYIPKNHKDLPGLYLANGDIVFNRTNSYELVGKSGVFWGEDKSFTLASYLIKVSVFLSHVLPDYLNLYITSPVCRKTQIEPEITAQTNQANFSGSKLKNVYCPIPPTKEQQAIVTTVNILMALCDALEQELGQQESRVEELMRSCVREVME